jgi:hypothetical protein
MEWKMPLSILVNAHLPILTLRLLLRYELSISLSKQILYLLFLFGKLILRSSNHFCCFVLTIYSSIIDEARYDVG